LGIGLLDDFVELRPRAKFGLQLALAIGVCSGLGLSVSNLGEIFPGTIIVLPMLGLPIAVLAYASLMNAMNMADGIDGLAGALAITSFASLALAASLGGAPETAWMALATVGPVAGFMLLNARLFGSTQARVFMGDGGSMLIGFSLATISIIYTQWLAVVPPVVALWICALPLIDGLAVIVRRWASGRFMSSADKDHLHHLLFARGLSVNRVVLIEVTMASACAAFGIGGWIAGAPEWVLLLAFIFTLTAYVWWSGRVWRRSPTVTGARADAPRSPAQHSRVS
jgi:UDP-GlcNAc:undecaprenyl-phosphate GlcNAc-1-phosphate transferase